MRASRVGPRQIVLDDQSNVDREAIVICANRKTVLSRISCEPSAELVSYVSV